MSYKKLPVRFFQNSALNIGTVEKCERNLHVTFFKHARKCFVFAGSLLFQFIRLGNKHDSPQRQFVLSRPRQYILNKLGKKTKKMIFILL